MPTSDLDDGDEGGRRMMRAAGPAFLLVAGVVLTGLGLVVLLLRAAAVALTGPASLILLATGVLLLVAGLVQASRAEREAAAEDRGG